MSYEMNTGEKEGEGEKKSTIHFISKKQNRKWSKRWNGTNKGTEM